MSATIVLSVLEHLGLDAGAFEQAQIVNEHLAAQVVHFMLNAFGQQISGVKFNRLTLAV